MILAIDVGNTNIVFALYDGAEQHDYVRMPTQQVSYEGVDIDLSSVSDIVISSVVPNVDAPLTAFCQQYLGVEPVFVTKDIIDIEILIDRPEEAGADRLVNALAVKRFYSAPAIIIDFGTATTFDILNKDGAYVGGAIAPGIRLSVKALEAAAAKLPLIEIKKPERIIGRSTVEAIQSGIFYGYVSMIEGMVARLSAEMLDMGAADNKPIVIATGGLAPLFAGSIDIIDEVDSDLTLKGLLEIYKEQK